MRIYGSVRFYNSLADSSRSQFLSLSFSIKCTTSVFVDEIIDEIVLTCRCFTVFIVLCSNYALDNVDSFSHFSRVIIGMLSTCQPRYYYYLLIPFVIQFRYKRGGTRFRLNFVQSSPLTLYNG